MSYTHLAEQEKYYLVWRT